MDLDARPLRCFIAVAELNSFSRAALRVNVSQPALSATIKELERRLGFALFDRSSRHVQLTTEGKLFLGNARRYVRESDILRQSWQEIRSNELRISAAFHTCLITPRNRLVETFQIAHEDVHLQIINHHHERGFAKLAQGEVDLLIAIEPGEPSAHVTMTTPQSEHNAVIERTILSTRPIGIVLPVEHPLAGRRHLSLADLEGHEIVVPNRFHGVAVNEQIRFAFTIAGARSVRPPEGNSIGVERYGALRRLPAIALNWFSAIGEHDRMVNCSVDGLGETHLSLIRTTVEPRPSARQFWDHAGRLMVEEVALAASA